MAQYFLSLPVESQKRFNSLKNDLVNTAGNINLYALASAIVILRVWANHLVVTYKVNTYTFQSFIFTILRSFLIEYSINSSIVSDESAVEVIVIGMSALIIRFTICPLALGQFYLF